MLYRGDDPIQDRSTKNRPVFGLSSSFGEPQGVSRATLAWQIQVLTLDRRPGRIHCREPERREG
jgi:hypothetical protein